LTKQTTSLSLSKPEITDKIVDTITQLASNFDVIDSSLADRAKQTNLDGRGIDLLNPPSPLVACKGDGSDDTTALQAIVNYCATNNMRLISSAGKVYGISSPITITLPITADFNMSTIKALTTMESVIKYNVTAQHSNISNIILDCNNNVTYGLYCVKGHTTFWNNLRILNVTNYGIYITADYEYFFNNVYIQGNGQTSTVGLRSYGDSHFSNFVILDCYVAINTNNYSFFNNIHAWLSSTAVIAGSKFMTGSGGGSFSQVYSDTYQYAFAPTSNTNFLNINEAYVFSNPTIYTSAKVNQVPSFFYFDSAPEISMVSITNCTMWALSTTSGLTGGGIFMNQPLYQWTGKMHNCMFTGIQSVPDNIVSSLTLGTGWTVGGINRLTKRNGRVHLELDCYYTGNLPTGTTINVVSFGNGSFPDGFYPKDSKKVLVAVGGSFTIRDICYGYLSASFDHSSLAITYLNAQSVNYISIDIEYEAVNSI
jgi:hypothetical protein